MKVKLIVFIFFSISFLTTFSQNSKKSGELLSFHSIASSSYLTAQNQVSIAEVYPLLRDRYVTPIYDIWKKQSDLNGEFWAYDGLIINIVSVNINNVHPSRLKLSDERRATDPGGYYVEGKYIDYREHQYFDEIKEVNNYNVLVYYFKDFIKKYFTIIDQQNRYYLMGSVTCQENEVRKAEAFLETLLQSIKFR
ncbi:hypothetical protein ORI89_12020 [Sphingobacterium sp. UT-1RO-CII-1]|uniref:hypothetical protein n=1 Tax=Sphingobacterium sp. UT-1RO-CII-1 TaxID=2995225 RepID=UPI00227B4375|nr:hypothetical protein [Sphingobacterium sp. UT-1RO-CII-1]MCY4780381.1 hypothetical protein [Sphingobacterium sp. UT-1RO-CII-1]